MADKRRLVVLEETTAAKRPSVDAARARLGGRIAAAARPEGFDVGRAVLIPDGTPGIVVAVESDGKEILLHVLVDDRRVRRLAAVGCVELAEARLPSALTSLAADARVFASIREGDPVRYRAEAAEFGHGFVVEKCRYGALVERDDGVVIAVGFRKLWPASAGMA